MKTAMYKIFIPVLFASCLSCDPQRGIEKEIENLMAREISFEGSAIPLFEQDSLKIFFSDSKARIVVFHDSLGCSSCRIQQIYKWEHIMKYAEATAGRIKVAFIFSPKNAEARMVELSLRSSGLDYPFFLDKEGWFSRLNPHIPRKEQFHTFLLDKNNKILLVGSPLNNEKLWELYKEQIREQLAR